MFNCPVCNFATLTRPPYETWPPPPKVPLRPPYENQLGAPSYEECSICRFEFGAEDNPGTRPGQSFEEYRAEWLSKRQLGTSEPDGVHPEKWAALTGRLESYERVPAAQAAAALLRRAAKWNGHVIARGSMHDLLFTRLGDEFPFDESVRVSWMDGIYEFLLLAKQSRLVAATDKCRAPNVEAVLDSFLVQLTGGDVPAVPSALDD